MDILQFLEQMCIQNSTWLSLAPGIRINNLKLQQPLINDDDDNGDETMMMMKTSWLVRHTAISTSHSSTLVRAIIGINIINLININILHIIHIIHLSESIIGIINSINLVQLLKKSCTKLMKTCTNKEALDNSQYHNQPISSHS